MFSELDKAIIRALQEDLPLEAEPYAKIARDLGITEQVLLDSLEELINSGAIRRLGAVLKHREMGFRFNPMIAWHVAPERVTEVGEKLASYKQVTHCYHRPMLPKLQYNLFTMVHFQNKEECLKLVQTMSQHVNISDYQLLFSEEEYKKCSMRYFLEPDNFNIRM